MKKSFLVVSFLILVSVVAFPASIQFSIMGGYSKITSSRSRLWLGGYYVSGLGLLQVAKGLHVGVWGAYHHWGINDSYFQEYIDILEPVGYDVTISGSASNVQIFPCLRYEFVQTGKFRPYVHIGAGLSIMNAKAKASVTYFGTSLWEIDAADESRTGLGGNFGIGARILTSKSLSLEALALANLYFQEGGAATSWLSLGIGFNFGR